MTQVEVPGRVTGKDGVSMVLISAGEFLMDDRSRRHGLHDRVSEGKAPTRCVFRRLLR